MSWAHTQGQRALLQQEAVQTMVLQWKRQDPVESGGPLCAGRWSKGSPMWAESQRRCSWSWRQHPHNEQESCHLVLSFCSPIFCQCLCLPDAWWAKTKLRSSRWLLKVWLAHCFLHEPSFHTPKSHISSLTMPHLAAHYIHRCVTAHESSKDMHFEQSLHYLQILRDVKNDRQKSDRVGFESYLSHLQDV